MKRNYANPRELFSAVLDLETDQEREAFLDEIAEQSPELANSARDLLKAHHEAEGSDFFVTNPHRSNQDQGEDDPTIQMQGEVEGSEGSTIGRYKLLQRIGEGGMGEVWMAEQREPVERKVALKIIKAGMDTKQVIARFEAERQALALMDHPHIARVLDGGATERGRPYFVMELVQGIPITGYCDQAKLKTRDRLELFLQVCEAVQHAHQKGIIHRDIKPNNIIVANHDGKPYCKVIDFGIAKATSQRLTEKTLFTRHGQMIGTPAYMSPEQAQFSIEDVDTRADIYSLGCLLYELLTGSPPLDSNSLREMAFDEMCRVIREENPPKPSTRLSTMGEKSIAIASLHSTDAKRLGRTITGDLDWIVMKSLEKDRTRRYQTASAFAEDVKRHLHHEPVVASPPSLSYRGRKFINRHKAGLASALAMVLLLVAGTVVSIWQAVVANREKDRADEEKQNAQYNEGLGWMLRAEVAEQRGKRYPDTLLYAARAIGFHGLGRPESNLPDLPRLIKEERNPAKYREALDWIRKGPEYRPIWASPMRPSPATGLSISATGRWLALASGDGLVVVWDIATGSKTEILATGNSGPVAAVAFDPLGSTLAIALEDKVQLWDVETSALREEHLAGASALAWSPGGELLAAAVPDEPIDPESVASQLIAEGEHWDYFKGTEAPSSPADAWKQLAFKVDPEIWSSGRSGFGYADGDDATVLDDMRGQYSSVFIRKEFTVPSAPGDGALELVIDYDDSYVAWLNGVEVARSSNLSPGVVDFRTTPRSGVDHEAGTAEVVRLGLSSDLLKPGTNALAIAGFNLSIDSSDFSLAPSLRIAPSAPINLGSVRLWGGDGPVTLASGLQTAATRLSFSPENSIIAAVYPGDGVRVFLPQARATADFWAEAAVGEATSVAVSPDGTRLVIGSSDGTISVWGTATAKQLGIVPAELRHSGPVLDLAFRMDGEQLASASADGTVKLWGMSGADNIPTVIATLCGHQGAIGHLCYAPGGEILASAGADGSARLWWVGGQADSLPNFFGYLEKEFYAFDPDTQQVRWAGGHGFLGVPARSLVGLWRSENARAVANYLLARGHWSAAEKLGADPVTVRAALLADAEKAVEEKRWLRVDLRLRQLEDLGGTDAANAAEALSATRTSTIASTGESFRNRVGLEMIWCPPTGPQGFPMGSPPGEIGRSRSETLHDVVLSSGFWIGKYELTQGVWTAVMGSNPSSFEGAGPQAPVENISWKEAANFCRRLTYQERSRGTLPSGWEYALPTEAQWEYACRAGTGSAFSFGDDTAELHRFGNYSDNSGGFGNADREHEDGYEYTAPVGSYAANPWGLHDMHGNVWEMCRDALDNSNGAFGSDKVRDPLGTEGSGCVVRGGCFYDEALKCRSASRSTMPPSTRSYILGFRPALVPSRSVKP